MRRVSERAAGMHKSAPERRTFNGHVYDSIVEMKRAVELDLLLKNGDITLVIRQCPFDLGPDERYRADFFVVDNNGLYWAEDVKGGKVETPRWRRVMKLWRKYQPCQLRVIRRGKVAEVLP